VATGANESYMSGLRDFLKSNRIDRRNTFILDCEGVGTGSLCYLTREGVLHQMKADAAMQQAAATASPAAAAARMHTVPSEGAFALARGYHALTLMRLDDKQQPIHWKQTTDRLTRNRFGESARGGCGSRSAAKATRENALTGGLVFSLASMASTSGSKSSSFTPQYQTLSGTS